MLTSAEILEKKYGITPNTQFHSYQYLYKSILKAMDEYSEQNCDHIQMLFTRPAEELKPLQDLYRKENPQSNGKFYLPDTSTFYKWIRIKLLGH